MLSSTALSRALYVQKRFPEASRSMCTHPSLFEDGFVVIPFIETNELLEYQEKFHYTEANFPEFKIVPGSRFPYVLGGFAAYGNPASFHNPLVKNLRSRAFENIKRKNIFPQFLRQSGLAASSYKLELLFDRMMHRHAGQSPTPESAHRDVTPANELSDGDFIFGGWVNLTLEPQIFVCKPGSHRDAMNTTAASRRTEGFNKLDKEEADKTYKPFRQQIVVPPGHLIIFVQHILHEVFGTAATYEQLRLFMGWRITKGTQILFAEEKIKAIEELGVPLIPSGQRPPMYSQNHASAFKTKPFKLCAGEKKASLLGWLRSSFVHKVIQKFNQNGLLNSRAMESLKSYGLPTEEYVYSAEDRDLMLTLHELD